MKTIKQVLSDLVAFQTTEDNPEARRQAIDYVEEILRQHLPYVKRYEWNGFESLYAGTRDTKTPKVLLAAHIDVVVGQPEQFRLVAKDGNLYGRGVSDMKFAIAAYLTLLSELDDVNKYDFGILITSDEEIGGYNGVKKFVDDGLIPKVVVLPDGGASWTLERAAKGMIRPYFTARGIPMHGSRTWEGESAIEKMMNFLRQVQYDIFPDQGPETNTFNIGRIQGGNVFNQISDICTADVDIRPLNAVEAKHILTRIDRIARDNDVTYELLLNEPAIEINLEDPLVKAFMASTEKIIGRPMGTMRGLAGSDARHWAPHNVPTLVLYPESGEHHSDHEWLSEEALHQFKDVIADYLNAVALSPQTSPAKSLTSVQ